MDLCHHRPLFSVTAVFLGAMAVGSALSARWLWILGGLLSCAVIAAIVLTIRCFLRRRHTRRALLSVAVLSAVMVAFFLSLASFHGADTTRLTARAGESVTVIGTVTDRRGSGGFLTSYALDIEELDGTLADARLLLTCRYVSDLHPGYRIRLTGTLLPLDEAAGEGFDAVALRGDGYVSGILSEQEDDVTLLAEDSGGLAVAIGTVRRALAAKLSLLCGTDAAGLPSALLLGDRSALTDEVRRDFARTGVSHILSISGMHMTLLFGLLAGFFSLLHIPKRLRVILLGVTSLGYLTLIGFLPSATRAVVMLGMVYLATLWSSRADPLTSLGLAGALIVAVTPYAVYDVGFWMSMTATLGLVAYAPLLHSRKEPHSPLWKRGLRLLQKLGLALLIGIVAMSSSLFLVAMSIGEVGILSPVVTLLLTPATAILLVLASLVLLTAGTPLAPLLGGLCEAVSAWMADVTTALAEPAWVVVSLRHPAVWPISVGMVLTAVILLVVRLPRQRRWLTVAPLLAGWMIIALVLGVHAVRDADKLHTTYLQPSSQADMLVLVNGRAGVICDMSNGSLTSLSTAVREAEANGATEISALFLTHYHTATAGTLSQILARETVRALYLPTPTTPDDYYRLLACLEVADNARVPAMVYAPDEPLTLLGTTVSLRTATLSRSTQPVLLLTLQSADARLVLCGASVFESPLADATRAAIAEADTVIFGHHGPLTKAPFGDTLAYRPTASVILSAYGDEAAYFDPTPLPSNASLWLGQRRMVLSIRRSSIFSAEFARIP